MSFLSETLTYFDKILQPLSHYCKGDSGAPGFALNFNKNVFELRAKGFASWATAVHTVTVWPIFDPYEYQQYWYSINYKK